MDSDRFNSVIYALVLVAVTSLAGGEVFASKINTYNYVPHFLQFYKKSEDAHFEDRRLAWDQYIATNRQLFSDILYKRSSERESLKLAFARFPADVDKIEKLNSQLTVLVQREIDFYSDLFPSVELDFDFYFAVCDYGFGGMVTKIANRSAMVTCVENSAGIASTLAHELAHAFHHQLNPAIAADYRIEAILLLEGLAVSINTLRFGTSLENEVWGQKIPPGGTKSIDRNLVALFKDLQAGSN